MNNNRYILGSNNNLICGDFIIYKFMEYMVVPFDRDYKSTILQESNCGLWMVTVKIIEDGNYRFSPFVHNHYCTSLLDFHCI